MQSRLSANFQWSPVSFVLCLFIIFVAPYLIELVTSEEISTPKLHQPGLVDGEAIDPSEGPVVSTYVQHAQALSTHSSVRDDRWAAIDSFPGVSLPTCCAVAPLISRPPPIS